MKAVDILRSSARVCRALAANGVEARDIRHVELYDEWSRMRAEGHKYAWFMYCLCRKYGVSESSLLRIVKRLDQDIEI